MRVEYTNTFTDILLFQAVHQFLSPAFQGLYGVGFFLIFWAESLERQITEAASVALCIWAAMWLVQLIFNAVFYASKSNRTVLTTHVVEIRDDGFYEETKFNKSLFFWPGVIKAVSRPGFLAVYISGHQAHVMPTRAFASKNEMKSFLRSLVDRIHKSNDQA